MRMAKLVRCEQWQTEWARLPSARTQPWFDQTPSPELRTREKRSEKAAASSSCRPGRSRLGALHPGRRRRRDRPATVTWTAPGPNPVNEETCTSPGGPAALLARLGLHAQGHVRALVPLETSSDPTSPLGTGSMKGGKRQGGRTGTDKDETQTTTRHVKCRGRGTSRTKGRAPRTQPRSAHERRSQLPGARLQRAGKRPGCGSRICFFSRFPLRQNDVSLVPLLTG